MVSTVNCETSQAYRASIVDLGPPRRGKTDYRTAFAFEYFGVACLFGNGVVAFLSTCRPRVSDVSPRGGGNYVSKPQQGYTCSPGGGVGAPERGIWPPAPPARQSRAGSPGRGDGPTSKRRTCGRWWRLGTVANRPVPRIRDLSHGRNIAFYLPSPCIASNTSPSPFRPCRRQGAEACRSGTGLLLPQAKLGFSYRRSPLSFEADFFSFGVRSYGPGLRC